MSAAPRLFTLQCHPATPCAAVAALTVALARTPGAGLHLAYELRGDLARLRLPAPAAHPAATDGLWQRTCFEAFVAAPQGTGYREYNFSPSGDWAAYAFDAERQRNPAASLARPRMRCSHDAGTLRLQAWLPPAEHDPASDPAHGPLGLCAVVEQADGRLSYWALRHPAAQPDFHRRDGWCA
jgi:hypothetical protein